MVQRGKGDIALLRNDFAAAAAAFEKSREIMAALFNVWNMAYALGGLGRAAMAQALLPGSAAGGPD